MSLLDAPAAAHAAAVSQLEADLGAGTLEERAVLLNLREEDRVPGERPKFQAALAASVQPTTQQRVTEALRSGQRALAVPSPRPAAIQGPWWTHVMLVQTLVARGYVHALPKRTRPPRRLRLLRPIGRDAQGNNWPFWITSTDFTNANDLRDRLGLSHFAKDAEVYRVRIGVGTAPTRTLHIPTAFDAGWSPAWRRPGPAHTAPWGMTRHLRTDDPSDPELLARPHFADANEANHVGRVTADPSQDYLTRRPL